MRAHAAAEPEAPVPGTRPADGRLERGQRTRAALVRAMLALEEEGHLSPTARMVTTRAGVGLRTLFMHFPDMETLCAEAAQLQLATLARLVDPVDPADPLDVRIHVFCTSRVRVLERLLPVMRAARQRDPESRPLVEKRRLFIEAGDAVVVQAFAPELDALEPEPRARRLDALYLASGGPAWESLRCDRGLTAESAAEVLHDAVTRAMAMQHCEPAPPAPGP
jgi:AcrR family transcriptional regulator